MTASGRYKPGGLMQGTAVVAGELGYHCAPAGSLPLLIPVIEEIDVMEVYLD